MKIVESENYEILWNDKKFYCQRVGKLLMENGSPIFKFDDNNQLLFKDENQWIEIKSYLFSRECPHCGTYGLVKNGRMEVTRKQRYICRKCKKTSSFEE